MGRRRTVLVSYLACFTFALDSLLMRVGILLAPLLFLTPLKEVVKVTLRHVRSIPLLSSAFELERRKSTLLLPSTCRNRVDCLIVVIWVVSGSISTPKRILVLWLWGASEQLSLQSLPSLLTFLIRSLTRISLDDSGASLLWSLGTEVTLD